MLALLLAQFLLFFILFSLPLSPLPGGIYLYCADVRQHDVLRLDTVIGVRQRLLYILKTPVFIASKPLTKIIVLATQPMNHIAVFIMKIGGATVKA